MASIAASALPIQQIETTDLAIEPLLRGLDTRLTFWLEAEPGRVHAVAGRIPGQRIGVKIRCGGPAPADFPSPATLAAAMHETFERGLPFKATAGLHHPWRHFSAEIGAWRHGFLNLAAAAAALVLTRDLNRVEDILSVEQSGVLSGHHLRVGEHDFSPADLRSARVFFRSYGSCSFDEPVEDLAAMGSIWAAR